MEYSEATGLEANPRSSIHSRNPNRRSCLGVAYCITYRQSRFQDRAVRSYRTEARFDALQADKVHGYVVRGARLLGERYRSRFRVSNRVFARAYAWQQTTHERWGRTAW